MEPTKTFESRHTSREKKLMLKIARETLSHYLSTKKILDYDERNLPDSLLEEKGVFVSIHKGKVLRGCMGRMVSDIPLYKLIQKQVISAANTDSRFPAVKYEELSEIQIEISVLGPLIPVKEINEIELGKHGIFIKNEVSSGTFLPQVAESTGWTIEEFLGYCSKDKVGIGWDGWKSAEIFSYTADVFSEHPVQVS